jgi:hypothetical protein
VQLTRFLPLREASSVLEDKEPRWSEFPGARKESPGWKAVHGGGSGGGGRGAEGAGGDGRASAKEEGHKGRGWRFLCGRSTEASGGQVSYQLRRLAATTAAAAARGNRTKRGFCKLVPFSVGFYPFAAETRMDALLS